MFWTDFNLVYTKYYFDKESKKLLKLILLYLSDKLITLYFYIIRKSVSVISQSEETIEKDKLKTKRL